MNNVQLLGNLTKDVELRFTQSGRAVATYTIAATNTYTVDNETKEQTAFINCVTWGKQAEAVAQLKKGNRAFVAGRLQTRSYEAQDGSKRYVTEVVTNFVGASLTNIQSEQSNFDSFATDENVPF